MCISSSPWFIVLFLPIACMFFVLYTFFRCTSREVKRMEGVSRSPVYSSFTETLQVRVWWKWEGGWMDGCCC